MKRPTLSNDSMSAMYPGRNYVSPSSKTSAQSYQKSLGLSFNSPKSEPQKVFGFPQKTTGANLRSSSKMEKTEPTLERKNSKNISDTYAKPSTPTQAGSGVSRSNKLRGSSTKGSSSEKGKADPYETSKASSGTKYSDILNLRDSLLKQARPRNLEVNTDIQTFKGSGAVKAYSTKNKDPQERLQMSTVGGTGTSFSSFDNPGKYLVNQSAVNTLSRYDYVRTEASDEKNSITPTLKQKNALGRILANTSEKGLSTTKKQTTEDSASAGALKVNNFFTNPKKENTMSKKESSLNIGKKNSSTNEKEELMKTLEYNMKMANKSQLEYKSKGYGVDESKDDVKNLSLATPSKDAKSSTPSQKASLSSFITKVEKGTTVPVKAAKKNEDSSAGLGPSRPYLTLEDKATEKASRSGSDATASAKTSTNADSKTITFSKNKLNQQALVKSGGIASPNRDIQDGEGSPKKDAFTYYITSQQKHHRSWNESDYFCQIYKEHLIQSFQALTFCKYLKPVDPKVLTQKKVFLPKRASHKDKKTVVFDLDETLIHCNESADVPSDIVLPIKFPHGEIIEAGINIRPYAFEILKELSQDFEIIVFTASHSCYANVVLDYLDPEQQYIHHRLFRESCVVSDEGVYIKDLRVFGNRNLQDLVLVDNAAYSYGYQVENGIPIIPYYDNKEDQELKHLIPYLRSLLGVRDVREVNKQTFKLHAYSMYDSLDKVLNKVVLQN